MANDLDKFTLQYQVDLKDSIRKLEELHKKMAAVGKTHQESASKLKDFVSDAAGEIGKLVPGLNSVTAAAGRMGAAFGLAGVAVAALAISIKAVMALRSQFAAQRSLGMDIGVSGARVEDYQRKFVRVSGGHVNREQAEAGLRAFSQKSTAAYSQPGSADARAMKSLGVNVGTLGGLPTGINDQLAEAGKKLAGMRKEEVAALAIATGMNQDWLLSLQTLGPEIGKVTDLTLEEVLKRKQAEKEMDELNKNIAKFGEEMNKLEMKLGNDVLPAMTKFIGFLSDVVGWIDKIRPKEGNDPMGKLVDNLGAGWIYRNITQPLKEKFGGVSIGPEAQVPTEEEKKAAQAEVDAADQSRKDAKTQGDQLSVAINQFAGAVQSFSAAVDTQQAWAAWAGEVGKAAGLSGGGAKRTPNGSGGKQAGVATVMPDVESYLAETDRLIGAKPGTSAAQAQVESRWNPSAVSPAGAVGLMQIMPKTQREFERRAGRKFDATNPMDSAIMHRMAMQENVARFGNVEDAQRAYNGGWNPKTWGNPETAAYVGKINAARSTGGGGGQGRGNLQLAQAQAAIAGYLHLKDVGQLQTGQVNKGDAAWAAGQIQAGLQNQILNTKNQLTKVGMPQQTYAKLKLDLAEQERGLSIMRQYSPGIVAKQQEGGQEITIGEMSIIINGVSDPKAAGQEVNDRFAASMNAMRNQWSTGIKG